MEFKNLAEVTQLEEVPEGASVLAATAEGEVVRVPGDGLGGGGGAFFTVTFMTEDDATWTADKTGAQIKEAADGGAFVHGVTKVQGMTAPCIYCGLHLDSGKETFVSIMPELSINAGTAPDICSIATFMVEENGFGVTFAENVVDYHKW